MITNKYEPQQKHRLWTVSKKSQGGLNRFYGIPISPSDSIMAQNIQLFCPREGFLINGSSRETNKSPLNTMMKQGWGLDRNVLRPIPGDPWGIEQHHWNTGAKENQQLNPGGPRQKSSGSLNKFRQKTSHASRGNRNQALLADSCLCNFWQVFIYIWSKFVCW